MTPFSWCILTRCILINCILTGCILKNAQTIIYN
ncbi:pentapeptide repeat-containing protein [Psychrobacter urativorans]